METSTQEIRAIGRLRHLPELSIAEAGSQLWILVPDLNEDLLKQLRTIPCGQLYEIGPEQRLTRHGECLPSRYLSALQWTALTEFLRPYLPPTSLPSQARPTTRLRLTRTRQAADRIPNVLLTGFTNWFQYAISAPEVRLKPLRYGVASDHRTVIWGSPLPSISGIHFYERSGIAIQCGFQATPVDDPQILGDVLGVSAGDLALVHEANTVELIAKTDFASASRQSVRETARSISRDVPLDGEK